MFYDETNCFLVPSTAGGNDCAWRLFIIKKQRAIAGYILHISMPALCLLCFSGNCPVPFYRLHNILWGFTAVNKNILPLYTCHKCIAIQWSRECRFGDCRSLHAHYVPYDPLNQIQRALRCELIFRAHYRPLFIWPHWLWTGLDHRLARRTVIMATSYKTSLRHQTAIFVVLRPSARVIMTFNPQGSPKFLNAVLLVYYLMFSL